MFFFSTFYPDDDLSLVKNVGSVIFQVIFE